MARGPEGAFWKVVRRSWPGHGQRVEASHGEVGEGTPDTVLSIAGRGKWIELKVWPDTLSPEQIAWHLDAETRGANPLVLGRLPGGNVMLCRGVDWNYAVRGNVRRAEGVSLQVALDLIRCALIGVSTEQHDGKAKHPRTPPSRRR